MYSFFCLGRSVSSSLRRVTILLTVIPMLVLAEEPMPNTNSFSLPEGWSLEANTPLRNQASTLEYQYGLPGNKEYFIPQRIFSLFLGPSTDQNSHAASYRYIEACRNFTDTIPELLFIEPLQSTGLFIRAFRCSGETLDHFILELREEQFKRHMVFVWDHPKGRDFDNKVTRVRIGYALQSAVGFLICQKYPEKCGASSDIKFLNEELGKLSRILSVSATTASATSEQSGKAFYESYYLQHLALFGFSQGPTEKCLKILDLSQTEFYAVCESNFNNNYILATDRQSFSPQKPEAGLRNVSFVVGSTIVASAHCASSDMLPASIPFEGRIGIAGSADLSLCASRTKDSSYIQSQAMILIEGYPEVRLQYHWDVPHDAEKHWKDYIAFIGRQTSVEILKLKLCKKNSFLYECGNF